jgi:hypothetical protein
MAILLSIEKENGEFATCVPRRRTLVSICNETEREFSSGPHSIYHPSRPLDNKRQLRADASLLNTV